MPEFGIRLSKAHFPSLDLTVRWWHQCLSAHPYPRQGEGASHTDGKYKLCSVSYHSGHILCSLAVAHRFCHKHLSFLGKQRQIYTLINVLQTIDTLVPHLFYCSGVLMLSWNGVVCVTSSKSKLNRLYWQGRQAWGCILGFWVFDGACLQWLLWSCYLPGCSMPSCHTGLLLAQACSWLKSSYLPSPWLKMCFSDCHMIGRLVFTFSSNFTSSQKFFVQKPYVFFSTHFVSFLHGSFYHFRFDFSLFVLYCFLSISLTRTYILWVSKLCLALFIAHVKHLDEQLDMC